MVTNQKEISLMKQNPKKKLKYGFTSLERDVGPMPILPTLGTKTNKTKKNIKPLTRGILCCTKRNLPLLPSDFLSALPTLNLTTRSRSTSRPPTDCTEEQRHEQKSSSQLSVATLAKQNTKKNYSPAPSSFARSCQLQVANPKLSFSSSLL